MMKNIGKKVSLIIVCALQVAICKAIGIEDPTTISLGTAIAAGLVAIDSGSDKS